MFAFSSGRREYKQKIRVIISVQFIIYSAVKVVWCCGGGVSLLKQVKINSWGEEAVPRSAEYLGKGPSQVMCH